MKLYVDKTGCMEFAKARIIYIRLLIRINVLSSLKVNNSSISIIRINRHMQIGLCMILSLLTLSEISIAVWASTNTHEQQQQILPKVTSENFTLKVDILGINSSTRNGTISITGSHNKPLTGNTTIDLYSSSTGIC